MAEAPDRAADVPESAAPLGPPGAAVGSPPGAARIAWIALGAGLVITMLKFGVFALTNSAAVLGDALESMVNLAAAAVAIWSTWYAAQPADRAHPYGHGRAEFFAVGFEGLLVVVAGGGIIFESIRRLIKGVEPQRLDAGIVLLSLISVLVVGLAWFVWRRGTHLGSPTLIADGKHLATDALTTVGVIVGLILVRITGLWWLDPLAAMGVAAIILLTGARLVRQSWGGLMDRIDPADDAAIRAILDEEKQAGRIAGYHKVRHRHQGAFHWIDFHIQVPGSMTVKDSHDLASQIEHRIEQRLGRANATAHVEPAEEQSRRGERVC